MFASPKTPKAVTRKIKNLLGPQLKRLSSTQEKIYNEMEALRGAETIRDAATAFDYARMRTQLSETEIHAEPHLNEPLRNALYAIAGPQTAEEASALEGTINCMLRTTAVRHGLNTLAIHALQTLPVETEDEKYCAEVLTKLAKRNLTEYVGGPCASKWNPVTDALRETSLHEAYRGMFTTFTPEEQATHLETLETIAEARSIPMPA